MVTLNLIVCANQLSSATVTTLVNALNAVPLTPTSTDAGRLSPTGAAGSELRWSRLKAVPNARWLELNCVSSPRRDVRTAGTA